MLLLEYDRVGGHSRSKIAREQKLPAGNKLILGIAGFDSQISGGANLQKARYLPLTAEIRAVGQFE